MVLLIWAAAALALLGVGALRGTRADTPQTRAATSEPVAAV
ncbi:hypothetical protein [Nocardia sp. NBC_00403]